MLPVICMGVKVCHVKGRTQIESVPEQGAEENIWTYEDEVTRGWT
jgi:hypothetical protein